MTTYTESMGWIVDGVRFSLLMSKSTSKREKRAEVNLRVIDIMGTNPGVSNTSQAGHRLGSGRRLTSPK